MRLPVRAGVSDYICSHQHSAVQLHNIQQRAVVASEKSAGIQITMLTPVPKGRLQGAAAQLVFAH